MCFAKSLILYLSGVARPSRANIFYTAGVSLQVKGYVQLAVDEGGTIHCGHGKDGPLELPSELSEVSLGNHAISSLIW